MTDPIKKKIQELCPDVMELKMGCEVVGPWGNAIVLAKAREFLKEEKKYIGQRYHVLKGRTHSTLNRIAIKEILGSPITLATVLRSLAHMRADFAKSSSDLLRNWDLKNDNYDAQSEETKKFIGELLK